MFFFRIKCFIFCFLFAVSGCSTNIYNYGNDANFELSPAREIASAPAISVLGGFSLGTVNYQTDTEIRQ